MFRYLLFLYNAQSPTGGMDDCIFKTDDIHFIEQFIYDNPQIDFSQMTLAYYDAYEDKYVRANAGGYEGDDFSEKWKFLGWGEKHND